MTRPHTRSTGSAGTMRFRVFDFAEEDELMEKASEKFIGEHGNPRGKSYTHIDKNRFLRCFARHTRTKRNEISIEAIDVDDEDGTKTSEKERYQGLVDVDSAADHYSRYDVSNLTGMSQDDCALKKQGIDTCVLSSSSNYENKLIGVISDDDHDVIEMSPSSTPTSLLAENEVSLEERVSQSCSIGHEIDLDCMTVVIFPDFILYRDIYCTESRLIFSCSYIKVEGSAAKGIKETFNYEWPIEDIINIESAWSGRVETAMLNLVIKSKDSEGAGNVNGTSDAELLKFAVYDPYWSEVQEAIKSLDMRYKNMWNSAIYTDRENGSKALFRQISRPSFSDFPEPFEDIIYPKGDLDAVSISKQDIELLEPERFINDTIIDFYIKYLKNKIQPEEQNRFHFFNSFFYRKLADLAKGPCNAHQSRQAFQRVRKWTRKVSLFEKDYVFIPVNCSFHWSLIVICHPGEVAHFKDDVIGNSPKVPCILHMDSIKGSHEGLKDLVQSYLCEEWKERHRETTDDVLSKFLCLRFVSLELPQQENSFDCGLFLLHYVELFLEEAPANFNLFEITEFSNFLTRNWFPPGEVSLKRAYIKKLIYEIFEDHSHKVPSQDGTDKYLSSQASEKNKQDTGTEVQLYEGHILPNFAISRHLESSDKGESPLMVIDELADCVVQDSQDANDMQDGSEGNFFSSSHGNTLTLSLGGPSVGKCIDLEENNVLSSNGDGVAEQERQQAAKRLRLL